MFKYYLSISLSLTNLHHASQTQAYHLKHRHIPNYHHHTILAYLHTMLPYHHRTILTFRRRNNQAYHTLAYQHLKAQNHSSNQ